MKFHPIRWNNSFHFSGHITSYYYKLVSSQPELLPNEILCNDVLTLESKCIKTNTGWNSNSPSPFNSHVTHFGHKIYFRFEAWYTRDEVLYSAKTNTRWFFHSSENCTEKTVLSQGIHRSQKPNSGINYIFRVTFMKKFVVSTLIYDNTPLSNFWETSVRMDFIVGGYFSYERASGKIGDR